ncbi:hypothetical protein MAM1_0168d07083 [Mucor ambiguus]|uniref:Nudix hydrolase domain-containing protein n=1 Tax=Mucor ambiguus TaxID=91626 RepID=A0A0C9MZ76_9FUNG|nr:hypothetical protein MAM1_0168d07083 [Mucor ambiguus]
MATATLPNASTDFQTSAGAGCNNSANLPGAPVIADEDLPKTKKKDKKSKDKKSKDKKSKDKKSKDKKKDAAASEKEPKPIRQAVGVIVIDPATRKVLMLSSRKNEGAYVLPRDDCKTDPAEEHPEKAALRLLNEKAGVAATFLTSRVGSYSESNKKGKVIAHHWMYEVHAPTLLETWPNADRQRVWVPYEDALKATEKKRMSHLALEKCSLANSA